MDSYRLVHMSPRDDRCSDGRCPRAPSPSGSIQSVSSLSSRDDETELMSTRLPRSLHETSNIKHPSRPYTEAAQESKVGKGKGKVRQSNPHSNTPQAVKGDLTIEDVATWQPFWLRKETLGVFTCLYVSFAVALLALLVTSQRHNGLLKGQKDLEILWKFAPTAIFTLLATFWARVELQTLRYFPWAVIKNEPHAKHDIYTLDYNAMISIRVMYYSLRKRHFFVFLIVLTSILLKVQVVLGPSLFYLDNQKTFAPVAAQTLDSFAVMEPQARGDLPMFGLQHAVGIQKFGMTRPFGVSEKAAYQTFHLKSSDESSRGTIDAPVTAVVDGIFMEMKCIPSTGYSVSKALQMGGEYDDFYTTLDLQFEGCEELVKWEVELSSREVEAGNKTSSWSILPLFLDKEDEGKTNFTSGIPMSRVLGSWTDHPRPICSALPQQFPPFVYFGSYWMPSQSNKSHYEMDSYASVICSPTGWISKVEIIDDGVDPKLNTLPDQESVPLNLNPWNILSDIGGMRAASVSGAVIGPLALSSLLTDVPEFDQSGDNLSLYHNHILSDSVLDLTKIAGPMVLSYQLRYSNESEVTGSRETGIKMLQIRLSICIPIIVLFVMSSFVAGTALVRFSPMFTIWARNPTTILGSVLFFGSESKLSTRVKQDLVETRASRKDVWNHSSYSPPSLRTWVRSIFALYSLSLAVALAVTLWVSQVSNGLATVDQGAPSLWWTSVPALAMTLITIYTSSSDMEIRRLSLHSCVRKRPCQVAELDMCLLDMLGLRALYHSLKLRFPVVTLSQSLAILCGFLAALSSLLFTAIEIREWESVAFEQKTAFANRENLPEYDRAYMGAMQSLITSYERSNFTWPKGTYGSLLFPTFDTDTLERPENTNATIDLVTPAATLRPTCDRISTGKDIQVSTLESDRDEPVYVTIKNKRTCPSGAAAQLSVAIVSSNYVDGKYYFSATLEGSQGSCKEDKPSEIKSSVSHLWGSVAYNNTTPDYYSIWRCAYTWAEVSTHVKMISINGSLQLSQNEPPIPDYTTIKPWNTTFDMPERIDDLWPTMGTEDTKQGGSYGEFGLLVEPFGKMKLEDFGDKTKENEILETLHAKRAVLAAQLANVDNRVEVNKSSSVDPELSTISAKVSLGQTRRLDQNATVTYVMIVILFLAFSINFWALISGVLARFLDNKKQWLLDMSMNGLAPDNFGSIIMTDTLLIGSNYPKFIAKEYYLEKPEVLYRNLAHLRFRVGGFMRKGDRDKQVTLGVLDDGDFQFLGS